MSCTHLTVTAGTLWRKAITYLGEGSTGQPIPGWTFEVFIERAGERLALTWSDIDLAGSGRFEVGPATALAGPQAPGLWTMHIKWDDGVSEDWWPPIPVEVRPAP